MNLVKKFLNRQRWYRRFKGGYWYLVAPMRNWVIAPSMAYWTNNITYRDYVIRVEDHDKREIWNENCRVMDSETLIKIIRSEDVEAQGQEEFFIC